VVGCLALARWRPLSPFLPLPLACLSHCSIRLTVWTGACRLQAPTCTNLCTLDGSPTSREPMLPAASGHRTLSMPPQAWHAHSTRTDRVSVIRHMYVVLLGGLVGCSEREGGVGGPGEGGAEPKNRPPDGSGRKFAGVPKSQAGGEPQASQPALDVPTLCCFVSFVVHFFTLRDGVALRCPVRSTLSAPPPPPPCVACE
jgi:hypothetical protein